MHHLTFAPLEVLSRSLTAFFLVSLVFRKFAYRVPKYWRLIARLFAHARLMPGAWPQSMRLELCRLVTIAPSQREIYHAKMQV
ncbi:uncharacterized protein V2V93DRAFT_86907 [Kockiozyma suomiensis]|uniref:uncharacterized protein n=1 Tax=Kockiozyma suomiensis TaxID=1337062 RepID=UPI0033435C83